MKIDKKTSAIFVLVAVVAFLLGKLYSGNSSQSNLANNMAGVADGKLLRQYKQKEISKTVRENARDLQKCYLAYLDKKPQISEGVIKVLFLLKENGAVEESRVVKSDFPDPEFGKCANEKIKSYYFSPPPFGINRNIDHDLAFKSQETAEREAKEWAEKQKLPKILPVGPQK